MNQKTTELLESVKERIKEQTGDMNRKEQAELYEELQEWAYRQYERLYIDSPDDDTEDLYYAEL